MFKKIILWLTILFVLPIIFLSSIIDIYLLRDVIFKRGIDYVATIRDRVNPKEIPQDRDLWGKNYLDISISKDADVSGMWTKPFDWPVLSLHMALLPDGTVFSFGGYAIVEKEDKEIDEDKKITVSNNNYNFATKKHFELTRDGGDYHYLPHSHPISGGTDFDVWDPNLGLGDNSHKTYIRPLVHDAFCSVVRVLDDEHVLILGGNTEPAENAPNTKIATSVFNFKKKIFYRIDDLKYERWYGSIVRLANNNFVMLGGIGEEPSIVPEILEKQKDDKITNYRWRELYGAASEDLFGKKSFALNKELQVEKNSDHEHDGYKGHEVSVIGKDNQNTYADENYSGDEWYYPRAFLAHDGSIVGYSYNKIWRMEMEGDGSIVQTGIIPLKDIKRPIKIYSHQYVNREGEKSTLISGERGSSVGFTSSSVMINNKIYIFGGQQANYLPSDEVYEIDFTNTYKPQFKKIGNMNHPRMNANTAFLPDGKIFIHGGTSFNDREFSVLEPEIFDVSTGKSLLIKNPSNFRRNYHSSLLLLPNGTILSSGGDVYNSEIYYPSYLFNKNQIDESIFSERPKIVNTNIASRKNIEIEIKTSGDTEISKITLLSAGSVTHTQGSEAKFFNLDFLKKNNSNLNAIIPTNKNILADGLYLLFIIDENGVPSEGKLINLNSGNI